MYSNEEQVEILTNFATKLINNTVDVPQDIQKVLDEHFWELFQPFERTEDVNNSESRSQG